MARRAITPVRLRWLLGALFIALAVPSALLVLHTREQLQWESLHRHRLLAEDAVQRIDAQVQRWVDAEETRGYADYGFLTVAGDPARSQLVQRSPLAAFPPEADIPGLLGWFQVDASGQFSSPLLPSSEDDLQRWGMAGEELAQRQALHDSLYEVLGRNRLVERRRARSLADADAAEIAEPDSRQQVLAANEFREPEAAPGYALSQAAFDRLNVAESKAELGKLAESDAAKVSSESERAKPSVYSAPPAALAQQSRSKRVEISVVPELLGREEAAAKDTAQQPLRIFESELDPFEFARLDDEHFLLFRRVWRDGQRSIQGALIDADAFLRELPGSNYAVSSLAQMSLLDVRWQGRSIRRYGAADDALPTRDGRALHRARLSSPLGDMELSWSVLRLPPGPGAVLVGWAGAVLFAVLLLGFLVLYRLALRQLLLARQQQDFVSAVSHELKTPLTSIRMYAELLRAGWASEAKRSEYYAFIHDESERLSRLIANVLQLARLERDELRLELRQQRVDSLFDMLVSRVRGQIEAAGFEAGFTLDPVCADLQLDVDADALVQILINLVDNALKFSAKAQRRRVEISVVPAGKERIAFSVRDFGPGVPASQRRRIFELFVRGGNELTRETSGTGIGLALVQQLTRAMQGEVECLARDPGAEFRLVLPCVQKG